MKLLFIGDIYGRTGRDAVAACVRPLRQKHHVDLVIANCDNAANGSGITPPLAQELYDCGIDLLSGGDHVWDQRDMLPHLDRAPVVLRPVNFPDGVPGKGFHIIKTQSGKAVLVILAQGRVYHPVHTDNPFHVVEKLVDKYTLGQNIDAIFVDFHAGATSEKVAMGHVLDGRVSAVIGTHTHIPTDDARILPNGTAYMTDVGMTGDHGGIIGAATAEPLYNFRTGLRFGRYKPAEGPATLCAVLIDIDDKTGLANAITPIRVGGVLGRDTV